MNHSFSQRYIIYFMIHQLATRIYIILARVMPKSCFKFTCLSVRPIFQSARFIVCSRRNLAHSHQLIYPKHIIAEETFLYSACNDGYLRCDICSLIYSVSKTRRTTIMSFEWLRTTTYIFRWSCNEIKMPYTFSSAFFASFFEILFDLPTYLSMVVQQVSVTVSVQSHVLSERETLR